MNTIIQKAKEKQDEAKEQNENQTPEKPVMTEEEMKKFISTISNTESIQGDYVFNGFLFLLQSISEVINRSPVEARDLMSHLQQHVFNNLMWESYRAFDAHRKKAHLIFSKSAPYIYEDTEEETAEPKTEQRQPTPLDELKVLDLPNSSAEVLAETLSGIMHNPHLPKSIYDCLADNLNVNHIDVYSPENILGNLKEMSEVAE